MLKTKLQKILFRRCLSNKDFGALIEKYNEGTAMNMPQITNIVNGKNQNYKLATLQKMCKALKVTPNEIIDWAENNKLKTKK